MTGDGRMRKRTMALAGLLLLGLLWAGSRALGWALDGSPETRARAFTYACLAGNRDRAITFLPDDDVQRVEFDRWRMRYFPSILDQHRPAGDGVSIRVESIRETPQAHVVRVTMASQFIGKRTHTQHWRMAGSQWRFDAAGTLAAHDQAR